jgi:hypothetical protein
MQIRQIALVAPSLTITQFELADVDVDIYIRHTRSMKPVNCVFVDNELVYRINFQSEEEIEKTITERSYQCLNPHRFAPLRQRHTCQSTLAILAVNSIYCLHTCCTANRSTSIKTT